MKDKFNTNTKRNRPIIGFTINKELLDRFTFICEEELLNKSKLVESLINKWVIKNEKNRMGKKLS